MVRRSSTRGFTLLEMLVASALSGIAIAAAFTFATFQVKGFSAAQDTQVVAASTRMFEDTIGSDIRSAGYGTTFWAGESHASFGGRAVVADGTGPLGVPAVRIVDGVTNPTSPTAGLGVMPGSDAITILRVESISTNLPSTGAGVTGLAAAPGGTAVNVVDTNVLRACHQVPNGSRLVLISDMVRSGEPASMLQQLAVPLVPGSIQFFAGNYGINPATAPGAAGVMPAPRLFGPGSLVTCVRLVTYWVDNIGRLRMFQSRPDTPASAAGTAGIVGTFGGGGAGLPIDPVADAVVADGVADLQIALFMSNMSPIMPGQWAFADPATGSTPLGVEQQIVETRAVRVTAMLSTPRARDVSIVVPPVRVENNNFLPNPTFIYRQISTVAELRNLRIYDLMSSNTRLWTQIRSFPP